MDVIEPGTIRQLAPLAYYWRLEMLRFLSEAEARRQDDDLWKKLRAGCMFRSYRNMVPTHFLAVEELSPNEWSVIELNEENTQLIIRGFPARQSRILREHVDCMHIVKSA